MGFRCRLGFSWAEFAQRIDVSLDTIVRTAAPSGPMPR
ncbi:MAG: hypothetical protein ACKOD9_17730 [Rubrivivax sp.]